MARTAATGERDALGLLAMGSIIANVLQGATNANLRDAQQKLKDAYERLTKNYGAVCREYSALRRVNDDLQKQAREYERIIDGLRIENSRLQRQLADAGAK